MGDYSYLEAWRAAAARMWPGEHGSRSFGECARCALAAEHGCLSPDQLHVTYWHVWASEWLIDFRLGACAGRGAVLAPHQRPRAKELRGRVYAAQLTSCAHVLPSSLPPPWTSGSSDNLACAPQPPHCPQESGCSFF